jgi:hypothetical protein
MAAKSSDAIRNPLFVSSSPHLNAPPPQNQESFLAIAEIN